MVPNEGGIAVHLNVLEVEVVCKVSKFFLEADGMAVSSHIPFGNVPNFKFKGGLISESIFNFVPSSSKCVRLLKLNFSLFDSSKSATFGPAHFFVFLVF